MGRILLITVLLSSLLIPVFVYQVEIDNWLAVDSPVEANILLVEGWLSEHSVNAAKDEFIQGNYEILVTTGGPVDEVFNLSSNGALQFDLRAAGADWSRRDSVRIVLHAFGERALGEYARYTIIHGEDTIGRGYTRSRMSGYVYKYNIKEQQTEKINVVFDNDFVANGEDRNLHIWKLEAGDVTIPARSEYTTHLRRICPELKGRPMHIGTKAALKAYDLMMAGIDSTRIISLDIPSVRQFNTYTDAVALSEWIRETGKAGDAVNVFSEGNHARRSLALYRYALPDSIKVGVIAFERSEYYHKFRISFLFGGLNTLRQLSAYLYTRSFFNHRWHYRRIVKKLAQE